MNSMHINYCMLLSLDLLYRKLIELGWTKEYINKMVKEKAVSESESIYGTLYGTLGDESRQQENM